MPQQHARHDARLAPVSERYRRTRDFSEALCAPLETEDYVVQSMADVSPAKWHLAHVTWFFEQFVLRPNCPGYREFDPRYAYLFNSYYESMGKRHARPQRGLLTRPTVAEVFAYRAHVDAAMLDWLGHASVDQALAFHIELGLHHEQQHQELLLMDLKHVFSVNPLLPAYQPNAGRAPAADAPSLQWLRYQEGIHRFGSSPDHAFCYDNETPRHRMLVPAFELASRLVTNAEWQAFVDDGGYQTPTLWLADGWDWVQREGIEAPLYWHRSEQGWQEFGLHGLQPLAPAQPVSHISYYEADAYATWAGARLPTEYEWELAAADDKTAEDDEVSLAPPPARNAPELQQSFDHLWQWTRSAYQPYPGFRPLAGALGEYNGKFMANQMVLRGSACITPPGHSRLGYRNFFYPHMRWQYAGLRLARDV